MTKKGSFLERLPLRGKGPAIPSAVFAVILGVVSLALIAVAVAAFLWNRPAATNGAARPRGEATETIVKPVPRPGGPAAPEAALKGVTADPQGKMAGGGAAGGPAPTPGTPSVSPAAPKPAPPAPAPAPAPKAPPVEAKPQPPPPPPPAKAPAAPPAPRAETPIPAPAPKAEAPKPAPAPAARGPVYIVRAGTFKGKENAEKLKGRLARRGLSLSEVKPVMNPKLGEMWVVELAPVSSRAQAEGLAAKVQSYERIKPRIIEMER